MPQIQMFDLPVAAPLLCRRCRSGHDSPDMLRKAVAPATCLCMLKRSLAASGLQANV